MDALQRCSVSQERHLFYWEIEFSLLPVEAAQFIVS